MTEQGTRGRRQEHRAGVVKGKGLGGPEQRDTSKIRTVLQDEKRFMVLSGVSLSPPREGSEDVGSRVE